MLVCIPAFNEEKSIAGVILAARKNSNAVIVCDDGSTDMTVEIAEALGVEVARHSENLGKGAALRTLFERSRQMDAEIIVTLDGDGQHDPNEIPKVIQPLLNGDADIVNGSRLNEEVKMPRHRTFGNKVLSFFTNRFAGRNISDTQSGFRAYTRQTIAMLNVTEDGLGVDSQILLDAGTRKLRIVEVPITCSYDGSSRDRSVVGQGFHVIAAILRVVVERKPLIYLGLPGLISMALGVALLTYTLILYNESAYFSIPISLIAVTTGIIGILLTITSLILYSIGNLVRKLRLER